MSSPEQSETPHLTESQTTVSPVPARQFPIHALLVLHLQLLADLSVFLPCRGDTGHNRHTRPYRPIHVWIDLPAGVERGRHVN